MRMEARRRICPMFVASAFVVVATGCESISRSRQISVCEDTFRDAQVRVLLGADGTRDLCVCTVDRVAERFPDAGRRWIEYQREVSGRLESRGVIGIAMDTAWTSGRGREIAEFAAVQLEIMGRCLTEQLVPRPAPPQQSREGG